MYSLPSFSTSLVLRNSKVGTRKDSLPERIQRRMDYDIEGNHCYFMRKIFTQDFVIGVGTWTARFKSDPFSSRLTQSRLIADRAWTVSEWGARTPFDPWLIRSWSGQKIKYKLYADCIRENVWEIRINGIRILHKFVKMMQQCNKTGASSSGRSNMYNCLLWSQCLHYAAYRS